MSMSNNQILLNKGTSNSGSFIANVNLLVSKLNDLLDINNKFTVEDIEYIKIIYNSLKDIQTIANDLDKEDDSAINTVANNITDILEIPEYYEQVKNILTEIIQISNNVKQNTNKAENAADEAQSILDSIKDISKLAKGVTNLDYTYITTKPIVAGSIISLGSFNYYVGRATLRVNWEGVELYRNISYEEIGEDGELSNQIKLLIDIPENNKLNVWAIASNISQHITEETDRVEAAVDKAENILNDINKAGQSAIISINTEKNKIIQITTDSIQQITIAKDQAINSVVATGNKIESELNKLVNKASDEADKAEQARIDAEQQALYTKQSADLARVFVNTAKNAAQEATEQADRAEEAANDSELAANKAEDILYKVQATTCLESKGKITTLKNEEDILNVATGMYIINADLITTSICALPVTSVKEDNEVPEFDCFYVVTVKHECPDIDDSNNGNSAGSGSIKPLPIPKPEEMLGDTICGVRKKLLNRRKK